MFKLICLMLLIACCLPWSEAVAHPFHISVAEMEYNPQSKRIEVSLKLQALDFEQALSRLSGVAVNVEKQPIEKLASAYLAEHFYLVGRRSAIRPADDGAAIQPARSTAPDNLTQDGRSAIRFVGKELETTWLWLYFEIQPPATAQELQLVNTVLFEITAGQINTVSVRHGSKRVALKMTERQPQAAFEPQWLQPE